MSELKIHDNGVPLLSANDIEQKAEEVIEFFQPEILYAPCETPLLSFVEETSNKFDFTYDLFSDLGDNSHNHKILGKFRFKPRAIFVDQSVDGDLRQKFILGHEFGHLVLHRNILVKRDDYVNTDITDVEWDFSTGKKILVSARDWLEWQANKFSSAILMPRGTFYTALITVQKSLDIHRNLGQVYLDEQHYSFRDFQLTLGKLKEIYQVSKANIEIRLNDLGLLIDTRGKNTKHISELFKEK